MNLVGERVVLRPERPEDAEILAQGLVDDPALGTMMGMEPEEETADFFRGSVGGDEPWFVITDPATGDILGEIGVVDISRRHRRAGLSLLVLPAHRRAGVAREAIELVVGWAQGELGLHRIELHTLADNLPIQGLAEAAGFVREGVLREYRFERGRFVDNLVYARLPVS